jgi:hypothetical protein
MATLGTHECQNWPYTTPVLMDRECLFPSLQIIVISNSQSQVSDRQIGGTKCLESLLNILLKICISKMTRKLESDLFSSEAVSRVCISLVEALIVEGHRVKIFIPLVESSNFYFGNPIW